MFGFNFDFSGSVQFKTLIKTGFNRHFKVTQRQWHCFNVDYVHSFLMYYCTVNATLYLIII